MPSLKEVKARIVSVSSTQQITKAMKMVAAAKLRKAQTRIEQMRPYSNKLSGLLTNITATLGEGDLPNIYGIEREVKNVLIVAEGRVTKSAQMVNLLVDNDRIKLKFNRDNLIAKGLCCCKPNMLIIFSHTFSPSSVCNILSHKCWRHITWSKWCKLVYNTH